MIEPQQVSFNHHGRAIAGLSWGDPNLPKMLALHGWLDNAGTFNRLAPLLAKRHHIVAIDLAGHGLSDELPIGAWYHYVDYLSDVTAVIEQLDWQQLDFLGHSMGGTLAVMWAAAFPDRVGRVISIDALGALSDDAENTAKRLRAGLEARQAWQPGPGARIYATREKAIQARTRDGRLTEADAEELAIRGLKAVEGGYRWQVDRRQRLDSVTRFTEEQVITALAACTPPVLFIRALDSYFKMPEGLIQSRLRALPDHQYAELPGGHHLHIDDAETVASQIDATLD